MNKIRKLITKENFSKKIMQFYKENNYDSIIDCVSDFFEQNEIEFSYAQKFLTKEILNAIKEEAISKKLIKTRRV